MFKCFLDVLLLQKERFFHFLFVLTGKKRKLSVVAFAKNASRSDAKISTIFSRIYEIWQELKFPIFFVDSGGFSSEREQILVYYQNCGEICKILTFS